MKDVEKLKVLLEEEMKTLKKEVLFQFIVNDKYKSLISDDWPEHLKERIIFSEFQDETSYMLVKKLVEKDNNEAYPDITYLPIPLSIWKATYNSTENKFYISDKAKPASFLCIGITYQIEKKFIPKDILKRLKEHKDRWVSLSTDEEKFIHDYIQYKIKLREE